jgi:hypothetical protein
MEKQSTHVKKRAKKLLAKTLQHKKKDMQPGRV